jgi:hypothetical protein
MTEMIKRGATKLREQIRLCKEAWKEILVIISVAIFASFLFVWLSSIMPTPHHYQHQRYEQIVRK